MRLANAPLVGDGPVEHGRARRNLRRLDGRDLPHVRERVPEAVARQAAAVRQDRGDERVQRFAGGLTR